MVFVLLVLDIELAFSTTGRPVLFVQHVNLTQVLDGNLSHSDLPVLEWHCRLTQLWLVKWTSLRKMWNNDSPVLMVSLRLKDANWMKNTLTSLEPQ